jgi:lysophospholipid acyltransferase (LPLAT)-like uncharacterized protein
MKIRPIDKLSGFGIHFLSVMVRKTCRFQVSGMEHFTGAFKGGKPVAITSWHGLTMMVVPFSFQHTEVKKFVTPIPDDYRGAVLDVFIKHLGAHPFPMNLHGDTTLSQGRQLVKIVRLLKVGRNFYIHPDGPAGPAYVIKPGLSYIAQKTKAVILPIGAYCRNAFVLPRWDQYTIPYPFSRISIHIGEPYKVPGDVKDLGKIDEYLTEKLNRVTMQAAANYYDQPVASSQPPDTSS